MKRGSASRAITLAVGLASALGLATPTPAAEPHPDSHGFGWEPFANDTRSVALGRSDLAAGNGASSFWMNPAVLPGDYSGSAGYRYHHYPVDGKIRGLTAAAALGWGGIGLSRAGYDIDGIPVRTADDPLGTGESYDVKERITVLAASYGISPGRPGKDARFDLAFGGALRFYDSSVAGHDGSATDFDLGATVRYFRRKSSGWYEARSALVGRNLTGGTYTIDQVPVYLPHHLSLGLALEGGRSLGWRDENDLRGLVTYTHRRQLRTHVGTPEDASHFGLEFSLYDVFALRGGYGTVEFAGGKTSWGLGLSSRGLVASSFVATVDFGQYDADRLGGWFDVVSLTLALYPETR